MATALELARQILDTHNERYFYKHGYDYAMLAALEQVEKKEPGMGKEVRQALDDLREVYLNFTPCRCGCGCRKKHSSPTSDYCSACAAGCCGEW